MECETAQEANPLAIVIFARVDDLAGDGPDDTSRLPRDAVALLVHSGIRLVLVSASGAGSVRRLQQHLKIAGPFVCEGGGAVHVPSPHFWDVEASQVSQGNCEIFRFNPPDRAAAVHLVRDLFVSRGHEVVTIGIGCDLDDYGVLANVDVPVVVRDPSKPQRELLRHVPGAYLTNATGIDGWSEALIGP